MSDDQDPVVLELAPLPREQIGPFFLLGLDKDAGPAQIESHWAQRVIWGRKKQIRASLGDINWAREVLNDPSRQVRADVTSFNADTAEGVLRRLAEQYGASLSGRPGWQRIDVERPMAECVPAADLPDSGQALAAITIPPMPEAVPASEQLLRQFASQLLDPWDLTLERLK
jgi:hypothetical protein